MRPWLSRALVEIAGSCLAGMDHPRVEQDRCVPVVRARCSTRASLTGLWWQDRVLWCPEVAGRPVVPSGSRRAVPGDALDMTMPSPAVVAGRGLVGSGGGVSVQVGRLAIDRLVPVGLGHREGSADL